MGCETGAQTLTLARRSPGAHFVSLDHAESSLAQARAAVAAAGLSNVELRQADLFALPFEPASFDHAFVCFVLEHLREPARALALLRRLIRPGGTITVFEGNHGPTSFRPHSELAHRVIAAQVEIQRRAGGDPMIGRQLHPLLVGAGFKNVQVEPRIMYADGSNPNRADAVVRQTFTAMMEGVRDAAIAAGLMDADSFDAGIRDLHRTVEADGVFIYAFFKGHGTA